MRTKLYLLRPNMWIIRTQGLEGTTFKGGGVKFFLECNYAVSICQIHEI